MLRFHEILDCLTNSTHKEVNLHRYATLLLSFLSRLLFSKPVDAQSTPVDSLHVLAGILALSILGAGPVLADSIPGTIHDKDSPVIVPSATFPTPQVTNGTLIIGTGDDAAATLKILSGGEVTVGEAVIGNSPNANGIVNVTGPDAIFLSTARDITVGNQGTGTLTVTDGGFVRSDASIIIGDKGERIKRIGTEARKDMELLFDSKIMLNLWVKVKGGWSDDERALRSLGYGDL